ncbi:hypothetical protein NB709_001968 [Xanthomonas sacchari]|uniref:Uncharacterized protein n=1 Tax=Xanthomonas sacchari TaxID=56458 RepID=A0ABT3DU41_9XANT|nr:hypothetical protein [Xanthomonas sacchari]MCW0398993.1 hypothetical protein [Xanthomonas sacchari]MCW0412092.1 hypothetical protein [Xanthomonas sacchari]MCW0418130.1 hypothetical protein [Xanthomonas sacchari]MCW0452740.1 hypothetical protein [Xanthomonas sacchari]
MSPMLGKCKPRISKALDAAALPPVPAGALRSPAAPPAERSVTIMNQRV